MITFAYDTFGICIFVHLQWFINVICYFWLVCYQHFFKNCAYWSSLLSDLWLTIKHRSCLTVYYQIHNEFTVDKTYNFWSYLASLILELFTYRLVQFFKFIVQIVYLRTLNPLELFYFFYFCRFLLLIIWNQPYFIFKAFLILFQKF